MRDLTTIGAEDRNWRVGERFALAELREIAARATAYALALGPEPERASPRRERVPSSRPAHPCRQGHTDWSPNGADWLCRACRNDRRRARRQGVTAP